MSLYRAVALATALLTCALAVWTCRPPAGNAQSAPPVDLSLRSIARREAIAESFEYELTIVNAGANAAVPFTAAIDGFECGHPRGDSGLAWHESRRVAAIGAGASTTVTWQTPLGCSWARAIIDTDRETGDSDRADNTLEITFRRNLPTYEIGTFGMTREGDPTLWRMPQGGRQNGGGYLGDFWFLSGTTSRTQPGATGTWSLSVPPMFYRLYAFVPRHADLNGQKKPDAAAAVYQVWDQTGRWRDAVTIDQERFADTWVPLGTYPLSWTSRVRLGDNVGASQPGGAWVLFDTIRAVPEQPGVVAP